MKQTHQSVALTGLLAVALAISGCTTMRGGESSKGASGTSGSTGSSLGYGSELPAGTSGSANMPSAAGMPGSQGMQDGSGSSGSSGMAGSSGASMQDDRGDSAARAGGKTVAAAPNSTVLAIEIMPPSAGVTEGDASMGTSGVAGTTGSGMASPSYRVTVRMDDGSTQVVTHPSTPDFRSGDRINVTGGAVVR